MTDTSDLLTTTLGSHLYNGGFEHGPLGFQVPNLPGMHGNLCLRHILRSAGLLEESECIQDTNTTPGMMAALAKAWELYGQQKAVILFLVEDVQTSKLDHRYIEKELWNRSGQWAQEIKETTLLKQKLYRLSFLKKMILFLCRNIPVIRRKFEEVSRGGSLDGNKNFFIDGLEVAVVYYRYGYMPDNYTEQSWDTRLLVERSLAVKCPDISTHLAGTKKVQQALARPGVLEKFFPDQPQVVEQIRATFAGLYTLDMGAEGDQTVAMALANPDEFVLKPQREGGGNNYFGEEIVRVLQEVKGDKRRAAYILMDRIRPRTERNILLRRGLPLKLSTVCSEIGVYGAYVRHEGEMVLNEAAGHILRTKSTEHSDAGIYSGVTVLDSAFVI
ncbi:glutathione synthetase-like isoform X3 [Epinephelus fuscoguttatus]|uniref:glutathione synthetase-like isoform X3 n=1 Tax=Epinephelus fuscoguttatus TaxID=293821 RepID=UPI0020D076D5|nr:glutathione synthetase-like isoform X3 [Epinephelus fuscoguttatus]